MMRRAKGKEHDWTGLRDEGTVGNEQWGRTGSSTINSGGRRERLNKKERQMQQGRRIQTKRQADKWKKKKDGGRKE